MEHAAEEAVRLPDDTEHSQSKLMLWEVSSSDSLSGPACLAQLDLQQTTLAAKQGTG